MSSGTCLFRIDEGLCDRPKHHPGDHMAPAAPAKQDKAAREKTFTLPPEPPAGLCDDVNPSGDTKCTKETAHAGDHHSAGLGETFPLPPGPADPRIPDSVRTRVRLHAAQTEYDLTVLRNRIDCMPTVTNVNKELRRKREQLIAELDAWTYLAGIAKRVD